MTDYGRLIVQLELVEVYDAGCIAFETLVLGLCGFHQSLGLQGRLIAKVGTKDWCSAAIVEMNAWEQMQGIRTVSNFAGRWHACFNPQDRSLGRTWFDFIIWTFPLFASQLNPIDPGDIERLEFKEDVRSPTFRDRRTNFSVNAQGRAMLPDDLLSWKVSEGDAQAGVDYALFLASLRERRDLSNCFPNEKLIHEPEKFHRLEFFDYSEVMQRFSERIESKHKTESRFDDLM